MNPRETEPGAKPVAEVVVAAAPVAAAPIAADSAAAQPSRSTVTIRLARFEGPLDLLLHLIKRDEVDIYDIPISHIPQQYLAYIELMRSLDLEVAGEFLVMAATLMRIKAKMLLPLPASGEEEDVAICARNWCSDSSSTASSRRRPAR
jgi:hypothetical protein